MSNEERVRAMDHRLEEYLYRSMVLRGAHFLHRDYEKEELMSQMAMADFALEFALSEEKRRSLGMEEARKTLAQGKQEARDLGSSLIPGLFEFGPSRGGKVRLEAPHLQKFAKGIAKSPLEATQIVNAVPLEEGQRHDDRPLDDLAGVDPCFYIDCPALIPYSLEEGITRFCIEVLFAGEGYLLRPTYAPTQMHRLRLSRFANPPQLYNLQQLKHGPENVILTDSLLIAHDNNRFLRPFRTDFCVWTSWYEGAHGVTDVDWSPLKGKCIYYLILDHSGHKPEEALRTADSVRMGILEKIGEETRFVGCIERPTDGNRYGGPSQPRLPVAFGQDQFDAYADGVRPIQSQATDNGDSRLPATKSFVRKRRRIYYPFVSEGTATLMCGHEAAGKSWLALAMAMGAFQGERLVDSWQGSWQGQRKHPVDVVYIVSDSQGPGTLEKVEALLTARGAQLQEGPQGALCTTLFRPGKHSAKLSIHHLSDSQLALLLPAGGKGICELVKASSPAASESGPLVIIDGFTSIRDLADPGKSALPMRELVRSLKAMRAAVLLVAGTTEEMPANGVKQLKQSVPWDSIVTIKQRKTRDAAAIGLTVRIEKGFGLLDGEPRSLALDFHPVRNTWEIVGRKRSKLEEMQEICQLLLKGKKQKSVALALRINVSTVKAVRRQLLKRSPLPASIRRSDEEVLSEVVDGE